MQKDAPPGGTVFSTDITDLKRHDPAGNRQPEPGMAGTGGPTLIERIKGMWQVLLWNAQAGGGALAPPRCLLFNRAGLP